MLPTRQIIWGVNALLVAAITYAAGGMTARILESAFLNSAPSPIQANFNRPGENRNTRMPLQRFQAVLDANVFRAKRTAGTTITAPTASRSNKAAIKSGDPGKLPIQLTLNGTIVMGAASIAFAEGPGAGSEGVYHLGECVPHVGDKPSRECTPAQAKLVDVMADRIAVEMNRRQYIVKMREEPSAQAPAPALKMRPASRRSSRVRPARKPAFASNTQGNVIETRIPSAEVDEAFANFAGVVNQARVVPYMVDGKPQGFQIRRIVPGSIYQRLGLRNSDIIKSVNGRSLTTADQALQLFSMFKNEQEISLDVERGSRPIKLNYIVE